MATQLWNSDEGWPYPDEEGRQEVDDTGELDLDVMSLKASSADIFEDLTPSERTAVMSRYPLDGSPRRPIKDLQMQMGMTRAELRDVMGSGLAKLRTRLSD